MKSHQYRKGRYKGHLHNEFFGESERCRPAPRRYQVLSTVNFSFRPRVQVGAKISMVLVFGQLVAESKTLGRAGKLEQRTQEEKEEDRRRLEGEGTPRCSIETDYRD